ncbi:MAG: tetratricopeptide repeat protein [Acidobacteriota bacterium]
MSRGAVCLIVGCVYAALTCGCTGKPAPPAHVAVQQSTRQPVSRSALQPVALPDLSDAATTVAAQLRDQYAALTAKINDPATTGTDLATAYGEMGKLLMAAEYRDAAEPYLLDAQALAPDQPRWPYFLAHLYRLRGETTKSAASFERALEIKPDDGATLVWLGNAFLDLGRPDAAEPLFMKAQSLQPRAAAGVFGLGRTALARRDYRRAVAYFEQTISLEPQASIVHYRLAMAYRGLDRLEDADTQLRQKGDRDVSPADPLLDELAGAVHSEFAYEHLGVEALNRRDFPAAVALFRRGVELAPNDPSMRHRLGMALALSGNGPAAAAEFQEVLRRRPNFASTHYTLGLLIAANGRYGEAIEQFKAAVRSNPSYVEARLQLAETLRRSGRARDSLPHYEQAATLDPRLADAPLGYAMALVSLTRYADARDRLSESLARYAGRPAIAHALIRLLAAAPDNRIRDGSRAVAMAEAQLAQEPPNPDLGEAMAMAMAETGRYDEAVVWQQQAMAIAERAGRVDVSKRMAENLALFQHHQPCRKPWRDDAPVSADGPSF